MYKYSGPRWRNTTPVASFNDQSNAIMLSGYKLDTIANVSSIWEKPLEAADTDIFEQWAAIFTGGKASELTDLPYKAERRGGGWLGYVLRKREGGDTIEFVGAAYVHGFFGIQPNWEGRVVENIRID
ncbi:hypothetical protein N0V91_000355 [Didymella pomorum]|uniref:Uncharacterized protein n=1 Tax=Didymella pomorum TaxID=749634 RepID=A0A9W8ZQ28_9PLEO|nr:hypothetical protein N0V91_000355 [Didymella pomorum]